MPLPGQVRTSAWTRLRDRRTSVLAQMSIKKKWIAEPKAQTSAMY
jgi:hypothetical protein